MAVNDKNWKLVHDSTALSLPYNELYYRYLRSLGNTGTLQQMIAKSQKGFNPSAVQNPANRK